MYPQKFQYYLSVPQLTQEGLANELNLSRVFLSQIETGVQHPSIETVVSIANFLGVSVDDLLVDSLTHSVSTANTEVHRLLIDCNETEAKILTRTMKELRAILYSLGI